MSKSKYKSANQRKIYAFILWSAFVIWFCLCLYLSWQSGEQTAELSGKITLFAIRILSLFGFKIEVSAFHVLLRASAHAVVFFVFGILCSCSFRCSLIDSNRIGRASSIFSASICIVLAAAAEVGKLWIPGRHLGWDILLDILGILCGVGAIPLIEILRKQKYRQANIE